MTLQRKLRALGHSWGLLGSPLPPPVPRAAEAACTRCGRTFDAAGTGAMTLGFPAGVEAGEVFACAAGGLWQMRRRRLRKLLHLPVELRCD